MPIIPPQAIPNQIGPNGNQPYVAQQSFGQMIGECLSWNPSCSVSMVQTFLNNALRSVIDKRLWVGTLRKGQIISPAYYSTGTIAVTNGSATVTGTGTNFTSSLVGLSLRVGYINPIYNIIAVPNSTTLTLELPWGSPSQSSTGYFIVQQYYSIPNIKFIIECINLQLQRRMWVNLNQATLNARDPSRLQILYPWGLASMPPDPNGNFQFELYPASMIQQTFPYLAYTQPPNLVNDSDVLPAFMRSDVLVARAIADCLLYRPKENSYYDPATALAVSRTKMQEFAGELMAMEQADEQLYRQDVVQRWEQMPMVDPGDAFYDVLHPVGSSTNSDGDW
jgi:hypothetical protein